MTTTSALWSVLRPPPVFRRRRIRRAVSEEYMPTLKEVENQGVFGAPRAPIGVHPPPTSPPALAINDTRLNRLLVLGALKINAHSYIKPSYYFLRSISSNLIVKSNLRTTLSEAATMQFVAAHTRHVPVPHVHCAFEHGNRTYIVMERVEGVPLNEVWNDLLPAEQLQVLVHLTFIMRSLRRIGTCAKPPPVSPPLRHTAARGRKIASCIGGSLCGPRIPHAGCEYDPKYKAFGQRDYSCRFGPFDTVREFHSWLRKEFTLRDLVSMPSSVSNGDPIRQMIVEQERFAQEQRPLVFTHGDLHPTNILLARREGKVWVSGLIDWECAGWYPDYWEYTSAYLQDKAYPAWRNTETAPTWACFVTRLLEPPTPEVMAMETTRHFWWGRG
ncbi:serine threonine protein kinase [Ophiostoma piceae UAMH 11346]|uniref:Serine threonine protein kinase n=1 Tax=Ophiostoma piceae (strain UAMH 11346) TaxID=1262450 RepID=S3C2X9_OPHP1|nr:serine threonine protein kinase [Ophiostoma piceae UAMH 11346]